MRFTLKRLSLPDWVYKYLGALLLILVPLYPKFPLFDVSGTFVSIRLEDLLMVAVAIAIGLAYFSRSKSLFKDKVTFAILLYLSVGFLSLLSAEFITQTIDLKIAFLHWVRRIEYFVPLFLGLEIVSRKIGVSFYLKIILAIVIIAFIYGFGQKYFYWPIVITQNQEYSRGVALRYIPGSHINSTFAGHYDLASFLVMILPLVVISFFIMKGRYGKIFTVLAYFSGMWLLVNTASRISLASYLLSVSAALFLIKKYKAIVPVVLVSLVFTLFSSNLLARYTRLINVAKERLGEIPKITTSIFASDDFSIKRERVTPTPTPIPILEDRSSNIRLNVEWPRAVRAFYKNPLLGTGYSSLTLATDNDYLRALGETGILGSLALFLIFVRIIVRFLQKVPLINNYSGENLVFMAGIFGSLPGLFVNALFIDIFEASKFAIIFWFLMGLCLKLADNKKT